MARRRASASSQIVSGGNALLTILLLGCGPEAADVEDFAELCGQVGPVQVLPLDDNEIVGRVPWSVARHDDRWLYAIRTFDASITDALEIEQPPEYRPSTQLGARVESVDRCGRDRKIVAEGFDWILAPLDQGEPWLGLREDTYDLYWFDPQGRFEARWLAAIYTRGPIVHGRAVYANRVAERDLVRMTLGDDGATVETEVLVQGVELPRGPGFAASWQPEKLLLLRDGGDLIELDLGSGQIELIRSGVRQFSGSEDRRWVLWADGDPSQPTRPLPTQMWLLDRETGQEESVAFSGEPEFFAQIIGRHLLGEAYEDGETTTMVRWLPGGESIELEGDWWPFGLHESGMFGGHPATTAPSSDVYVFAPNNGTFEQVAGPIESAGATSDGLWVRDESPYEHLQRPVQPYDLLLFPWDTLELELVVRRIYDGAVALGADQWIYVARVDYETDGLGDLELFDETTDETRVVDRSVSPFFEDLEPHETTGLPPWRTDEIVYQVRDLDGLRTGLWRANFAQ